MFRSTDSGAHWTDISAGNPAATTGQVALTVAFDGTLYAAELSQRPGEPLTRELLHPKIKAAFLVDMDNVQANASVLFNGFVADPRMGNSNLVYLSGLFTRCCFPFSGRVLRGNASLAPGSQWTSIASTKLQPGGV